MKTVTRTDEQIAADQEITVDELYRRRQFDNYELTTMDYTLKYYLEHNENLDDEDIEWCNLVRKKIDTIMGIA